MRTRGLPSSRCLAAAHDSLPSNHELRHSTRTFSGRTAVSRSTNAEHWAETLAHDVVGDRAHHSEVDGPTAGNPHHDQLRCTLARDVHDFSRRPSEHDEFDRRPPARVPATHSCS